jgi:ribosome-associated protein
MDSKKLALLCRDLADNKKAENTAVLDVRKLSSVTDYFVIATGTSQPHLRAIAEEITSRLRDEHDLRPVRTEGSTTDAWMVLDYFDVIVHVMNTETRARYDLEGLWGDAAPVKPKQKTTRPKLKTTKPQRGKR